MLLGVLNGLSVVQHQLLEVSHQPGEVGHGGGVVVLHAGRSVASLDTDVHIDQLLPTALLQLIQLQSKIDQNITDRSYQFTDYVSSQHKLAAGVQETFLLTSHLLLCRVEEMLETRWLRPSVSSFTCLICLSVL